jgi:dihydroorotate dehydrogenase electron transfer subunit
VSRRTLAPFGRRRSAVTGVRSAGPYRILAVTDQDGPPPRPGQFYMLAAAEGWGAGEGERPFLPRAFSYLQAGAGELSFLLEDVGPGTHRLAALGPGDGLWLTGPLGIGFAPPDGGGPALLAGGGIGIVPLAAWQQELGAGRARALLGFRTADHARAGELLLGPEIATDDGSAGHHGRVTDLLAAALDEEAGATVYACGPPAMLEAVRALCAERGARAQLALESGMACGYGACYGCVVPTRAGYVRLCVDGPVLDAADLESALVAGAGH